MNVACLSPDDFCVLLSASEHKDMKPDIKLIKGKLMNSVMLF